METQSTTMLVVTIKLFAQLQSIVIVTLPKEVATPSEVASASVRVFCVRVDKSEAKLVRAAALTVTVPAWPA